MLRALIGFSIREPLIMLIVTAILIGFGLYGVHEVPIDAIPNIGENQVIIFTAWPGRSPKDVEDQVTYPLSVSMLAVPDAESVRGKSLFGYSFVQVTFKDSTDFYWARSRVAEQLGTAAALLPEGVVPTLGPDATGLGQVLYYVLEPPEAGMNLAELRSLQDFVVKYELQAVPGVSEVASVGGYVRQYQIEIDPDKLRFHDIPLDLVIDAVRKSNIDVGAKTVESGGMEFIIRGRGFIGADQNTTKAVSDIESTVVRSRDGVPIRIRDLGQVQLGPEFRRGAIDLNGAEAVGGVIVMRFGENPRKVIDLVKAKMAQIQPSLKGVTFKIVYDRTGLINETIATLTTALTEEVIITAVVILLFLLHLRASLVVAITLPIAVLMAFIAMNIFSIDANIMSLAGIAIAIGTMVDMGIVVSESIYGQLAEWEAKGRPGGKEKRLEVIYEAAVEVAPAVVTAVMTTVVSFLPVFMLTGRDYKLFAPLAWTKTFSITAALIVSITLVPLLSRLFLASNQRSQRRRIIISSVFTLVCGLLAWTAGANYVTQLPVSLPVLIILCAGIGGICCYWVLSERLRPVDENPIGKTIHVLYEPTLRFFMAHKLLFFSFPTFVVLLGLGAWVGMPVVLKPFEKFANSLGVDANEVPGFVAAKHLFPGLASNDWIALDEGSWFYMPTLYPAASFSQALEVLQTQDTLIREIPEVENVLGKIGRIDSALDPAPAAMIETYVMLKPVDQWRPGVTTKDIWEQINAVATLPGVTPASPLQPIEGRVVMLQSGIKAPMAIRIYGDSLDGLAKASIAVADRLKQIPQVNGATVNPDIVLGKPYVEFDVNRETAARYGMSTAMVNQIIETALGGSNVTRTVEGRERYPIRVRYERDLREQIDTLNRLPVVTHSGEVIPLSLLAEMKTTWGPGVINSEDARLVAHVSFSSSGQEGALETIDAVETSLHAAQQDGALSLPTGYALKAVGSFQNQIEANNRLLWVVPLVILTNLFIIYLQFRNLPIALAVFSGIPVAFAGGMIFLAINDIQINTAVWVGFIALFGIAVDDGVVMTTYLDQVFTRKRLSTNEDIRDAVVEAGLKRIRPCLMTTFTTIIALLPVIFSTGRGSDVAKAMAWPVIGGMTVALLTLFVVPVLFASYQEFKMNLGTNDRYWAGTEEVSPD